MTPQNLPALGDTFVGRDEDIRNVVAIVQRARAVSLTGGPGVGKTRLSLQVAQAVGPDFPDGTCFVELAPVADPALVVQAVASALSVPERPGEDLVDTLVGYLKERKALVVVDNCEHVVAAVAAVADTILRACPGVSMLFTSQERVGLSGEVGWRVPSLTIPHDVSAGVDELLTYDSVRLFCDRAAATSPGFALTPDIAPAVEEVCRRLDGIPLAIELAAATVSVLSPQEIAARLDDRFRLLTRGKRTVARRHQTLLNALEWSYGLLEPSQKMVLARLAVFAGGATLEAAEAVCAGGEADERNVFDILSSLIDKSLVLADTASSPTRYRLLETVRFFGRDRLAEGDELPDLRRRHAWWFLGSVERAEPGFSGPDQEAWFERIHSDYDNVRVALEWAASPEGDAEVAQRLAGSLTLFWRVRGYFSEGQTWLATVLALEGRTTQAARAKALWGLGFLGVMLDRHEQARLVLVESIELFTEAGDDSGCARSLLLLGNSLVFAKPDEALPVLERSVALSRQALDTWCLSHSLAIAGIGYIRKNNVVKAREVLDESIAVGRTSGDTQGLRLGLAVLGQLVLSQGDYEAAEVVLGEALGLMRQLGDSYGVAICLTHLGDLQVGLGQLDDAAEALQEGLVLARETANPYAVSNALCSLGRLAFSRGEIEEAKSRFDEADASRGGIAESSVDTVFGLGELALHQGNLMEARSYFEHGLVLSRKGGYNPAIAMALYHLGNLARLDGNRSQSSSLHHEALDLRLDTLQRPGIARSLAALAALAADAGRHDEAARLFGAAEVLREAGRYVLRPDEQALLEADIEAVRAELGAAEFVDAWAQGRAMSSEKAAAYASRGRGSRSRPASGWESLTKTERNVADLVAEGLSNAEIATRLFTSPRTASTHLSHIFTKLGIASRTELAVAVLARQGDDAPEGLQPRLRQ